MVHKKREAGKGVLPFDVLVGLVALAVDTPEDTFKVFFCFHKIGIACLGR
jgi:hypothetical protein